MIPREETIGNRQPASETGWAGVTRCAWIIYPILAFLVCAGLRGFDILQWQEPAFQIDGEMIQAGSDSYAWLAGAKGLNQYTGDFLPNLVRWIHDISGWKVGNIGFWLPALLAPLAAVPICLLALWWGWNEAAIASGVLTGISLGFLFRTRIGFLDTDTLTLFLPLCLALLLVAWLESTLRPPWGRGRKAVHWKFFLSAVVIGLIAKVYITFYPSGEPIAFSIIACAFFPALLFGGNEKRLVLAAGLCAVFLTAQPGVNSVLFSGPLVALAVWRPAYFEKKWVGIVVLAFLACCIVLYADVPQAFWNMRWHLLRYGSPVNWGEGALKLPNVTATVNEALAINYILVSYYIDGSVVLLAMGMAGCLYLLIRRPAALVFAPLFVLGLASMKLGSRFSMYGAALSGIGLGCGLTLAMRDLKLPAAWRRVFLMLLVAGLLVHAGISMFENSPHPFLSKEVTRALLNLKNKTSRNAQLWTWWDLGHAARYYAERSAFADGTRNNSEYVLPLAFVFTTNSVSDAYEVMSFAAVRQEESEPMEDQKAHPPLYRNPFDVVFNRMETGDEKNLLRAIRTISLPAAGTFQDQYLALSWEGLAVAGAISRFGTWDLATGGSHPGTCYALMGGVIDYDLENGELRVKDRIYRIQAIELLGEQGRRRYAWPGRKDRLFVLCNEISKTVLMMDKTIYDSLMVQMLIEKPERFEPHFTLIEEGFPFARIFRLNRTLGYDQ
ncbi:MAG: hypothetical protein HY788_02360 [Deltaproteobacteria bacterium]|nr:hypothetical protein [Deltaproteobacteria bacterium]